MNIRKTNLQDVVIIEPKLFKDKRGYFCESFNYDKLTEHIGQFNIIQVNKSKSKSGVLRGLHFQKPPYTQAKIVGVLKGVVLDVIVDIRKDSPTFGMHQTFVLNDTEMMQLYVPRGFAHGFIVLSRNAIFQYVVDNIYSPDNDSGIIYIDETLNIDWELQNLIVSDKDKMLKSFKEQEFYNKSDYLL